MLTTPIIKVINKQVILSTMVKPGFIGLVGRVFANGRFKMVLDTSLLNTQHYKVRFKSKAEQSRERSSALPYTSM